MQSQQTGVVPTATKKTPSKFYWASYKVIRPNTKWCHMWHHSDEPSCAEKRGTCKEGHPLPKEKIGQWWNKPGVKKKRTPKPLPTLKPFAHCFTEQGIHKWLRLLCYFIPLIVCFCSQIPPLFTVFCGITYSENLPSEKKITLVTHIFVYWKLNSV